MRHASSKSTNNAFITNDNSNEDEDIASTVIENNYAIFRDCVADTVIERLAPQPTSAVKKKRVTKARKNQIKPVERSVEEVEDARVNDAEDLGDFIEVGVMVWYCAPSLLCRARPLMHH